jgi:putative two-component system response regulator
MMGKIKILMVEHDTPAVMLMVHLLTCAGCRVKAAGNAAKGMAQAQAGDFDLITLAADLPGLNGFEFCRWLKKDVRLRHTPVVLVSGRSSQADARRGTELGAADYITKPLDPLGFASRLLSHIHPTPIHA